MSDSRETQIRAHTAVVRRQRLRFTLEDVAKGGDVEMVEKAAGVDAVLRPLGESARQMSPIVENGLADLSVYRRADGHTDEAARFPMSKRDRVTTNDTREIRASYARRILTVTRLSTKCTCSRSLVVNNIIVKIVFIYYY